jgi:hypothetical protein
MNVVFVLIHIKLVIFNISKKKRFYEILNLIIINKGEIS